jgi:hypothetical protein
MPCSIFGGYYYPSKAEREKEKRKLKEETRKFLEKKLK